MDESLDEPMPDIASTTTTTTASIASATESKDAKEAKPEPYSPHQQLQSPTADDHHTDHNHHNNNNNSNPLEFDDFANSPEADATPHKIPGPNDPIPSVVLDEDQDRAVKLALMGQNLFITGPAGHGCTFTGRVIKHVLRIVGHKLVRAVAPTEVSSRYINGCTLHAFLGLGIAQEPIATLLKKSRTGNRLERWTRTDVLIFDDISGANTRLFEIMDTIARSVRKRPTEAFGGIQVIVLGDFFGLPPPTGKSKEGYLFHTSAWNEARFRTVFLRTSHRHISRFAELVGRARVGELDDEDCELLKSRTRYDVPDDGVWGTKITGTADQDMTQRMMASLSGRQSVLYTSYLTLPPRNHVDAVPADSIRAGVIQKQFASAKPSFVDKFPGPTRLRLRKGAQVMLTANLPKFGLLNGAKGVVTGFRKEGGMQDEVEREYRKRGKDKDSEAAEKTDRSLLLLEIHSNKNAVGAGSHGADDDDGATTSGLGLGGLEKKKDDQVQDHAVVTLPQPQLPPEGGPPSKPSSTRKRKRSEDKHHASHYEQGATHSDEDEEDGCTSRTWPVVQFAMGTKGMTQECVIGLHLFRKFTERFGYIHCYKIPLALAFCATVRDLQGISVARGVLDFSPSSSLRRVGYAYYALSRIRTWSGVYILSGCTPDVFVVNPVVKAFYAELESKEKEAKSSGSESDENEIRLSSDVLEHLAECLQNMRLGVKNAEAPTPTDWNVTQEKKEKKGHSSRVDDDDNDDDRRDDENGTGSQSVDRKSESRIAIQKQGHREQKREEEEEYTDALNDNDALEVPHDWSIPPRKKARLSRTVPTPELIQKRKDAKREKTQQERKRATEALRALTTSVSDSALDE